MSKAPITTRIEDVRAALQSAARNGSPRQTSAFEAIEILYPEITALKEKRFTDAEILDLLNEKGLAMALGTFRQYYGRAARNANGTKNGTRSIPAVERKTNSQKNGVSPKPSELAHKPAPRAGEVKAAFGHRLCDDDV